MTIYKYSDEMNNINTIFQDDGMKTRLTTHLSNTEIDKNNTIYIYNSDALKALIYIDEILNPDFKFTLDNNGKFSGVSYFQIFYVKMSNNTTTDITDLLIEFVKSLSDDSSRKMSFIICAGHNDTSNVNEGDVDNYQILKIGSHDDNKHKLDDLFTLKNTSELNYVVIINPGGSKQSEAQGYNTEEEKTQETNVNSPEVNLTKQEEPLLEAVSPAEQEAEETVERLAIKGEQNEAEEEAKQKKAESRLTIKGEEEKVGEEAASEPAEETVEDIKKEESVEVIPENVNREEEQENSTATEPQETITQKEDNFLNVPKKINNIEQKLKEQKLQNDKTPTQDNPKSFTELAGVINTGNTNTLKNKYEPPPKKNKGGKRRTKKNKGKKVEK
jgi:hypothetical protein